jgi:hypothetical protein
MTKVTMDLNKLNNLLDQHGPIFDAWPAELRRDAETLLETSAEARDALADAQTLANLLNAMPDAPAQSYLAGRIVARAGEMEDPWQRLIEWLSARLWRPVLAAGLPLAFGFAVGMVQLPPAEEDAYLAADLGLMAFSSAYGELNDEN